MLPCTLCGYHIIFRKLIAPLEAEYRMAVAGGNGIADIRLTAQAVTAVFRLPVDGVTGNADDFLQNGTSHERDIVAAGTVGRCYGRGYLQRSVISAILGMVIKQHRLVVSAHARAGRN